MVEGRTILACSFFLCLPQTSLDVPSPLRKVLDHGCLHWLHDIEQIIQSRTINQNLTGV